MSRQVWPAAGPVGFDSFETEATVYGGVVQWWEQPAKFGVPIIANADLLVHGARLWRLPNITGESPDPVLHMSADAEAWSLDIASVVMTSEWDTTGWETVLFAEPVPLVGGATTILWMSTASMVDKARDATYFPAPRSSRGGLFTSLEPSGRYELPAWSGPNEAPTGTASSVWYWIDPLVSAV